MHFLRHALVAATVGILTFPALAQDDAKPAAAKPKRKQTVLKISKETTVIDGPLDDEGFVDYVGALNNKFKAGVKVEDNAAVWLARANGIHELNNSPQRDDFFEGLGIKPVPVGGKVAKWQDFTKKFAETQGLEQNALWDRRARGRERPWTAKDDLVLARWVEANEEAMDMFVRASKCSRYYTPYLGDKDEPGPQVIAVLLPVAQESREAVRMLTIRAMYRLGNDDVVGAMEDTLACHRLGRLISQGFTIIEVLVGVACDAIAGDIDAAISRHPKLTSVMALKYQKQLEQLPAMHSMADKVDVGERFMMLDVVTSIVQDGPQAMKMVGGLAGAGGPGEGFGGVVGKFFTRTSVDWNQAAKDLNRWYDDITTGMRKPTRAERQQALEVIDQRIKAAMADTRQKRSLFFAVLSRKRRTEVMTNVLVGLLMPAVMQAQTATDRGEAKINLSRLAFGIEAYKRDTGEFPKKLDNLVPKYISNVPNDIFSAKSFNYETADGGYKVYSVGRNGKDDGGIPIGNDGSDDLVVQNPPYVAAE